MRTNQNQSGIAHVLLVILVVVVLGAAVVVGLRVRDNNKANADTTTTSQIKTAADLIQSQKDLDSVTAPDPTQLDSDIKSLL